MSGLGATLPFDIDNRKDTRAYSFGIARTDSIQIDAVPPRFRELEDHTMIRPVNAVILLMIVFLLAFDVRGQDAAAKSDPQTANSAKDEQIRKLFDLMGVNKLGQQVWERLSTTMIRSYPQVPETVWQEIDKEFKSEFSSGRFEEVLIPIYRKYFSIEEVGQLILFYQSAIGKKFVEVSPQLFGEAMTAGETRGREILKRIQEKLKQKGYSIQAE